MNADARERNEPNRAGTAGEWRDISVGIDPGTLPVWPGSPPVRLTRIHSLDDGEDWNETELDFSVHTGTHIDAPAHFVSGGGTVDEILDAVYIRLADITQALRQVGGHEHAGDDFVAVGDTDHGIKTVSLAHGFDGVGDDLPAGQGFPEEGLRLVEPVLVL